MYCCQEIDDIRNSASYEFYKKTMNETIDLEIYGLVKTIRGIKNKTLKQRFILFAMWLIGF